MKGENQAGSQLRAEHCGDILRGGLSTSDPSWLPPLGELTAVGNSNRVLRAQETGAPDCGAGIACRPAVRSRPVFQPVALPNGHRAGLLNW